MGLAQRWFRPRRLVLVGCGAGKVDFAAPPMVLYTGSYHRLCLQAAGVLTARDRIGILSAKYGLVGAFDPVMLEPYDLRLGQPGSVTADQVREQAAGRGLLDPADVPEVVVLAGGAHAALARQVWPHASFPLAACRGIGEQRQRLARLVEDHQWQSTLQRAQAQWHRLVPDEQAAHHLDGDLPGAVPPSDHSWPGDGEDVEELLAASDSDVRRRAATLEPAEYPGVGVYPHPVYLSGVDNADLRAAAAGDWLLGVMVQPGNATARSIGAYHWYAADNGCYSQGARFNPAAWLRWVARLPRDTCIFVAAPDVWGDHAATLCRADPWLDRVRLLGFPVALAAQDGLQPADVPWDRIDCLMVGGTDPWRASPAVPRLLAAARQEEKWLHLGRVNSWRRLRWAASLGFDSADSTYLAFGPATNLPRLLGWLDGLACGTQQMLPLELAALDSGGSR
jgi:Family of unknown function (DUF6884)